MVMEELTGKDGANGVNAICNVAGVFEELPPQLVRKQIKSALRISLPANILRMEPSEVGLEQHQPSVIE
jgi:hypothetical protein